MRRSIFDAEARESIRARLGALGPDSRRRWGRMGLNQAVVHMGAQLGIALGEIVRPPQTSLLGNPLVAYLVIHLLPWATPRPTGESESPSVSSEALAADIKTLVGLIDRVGEKGQKARWAAHPAFGQLSGRSWGVLMYRHLDRHLRQFGA
jgi:hypothetical protein